MNYLFSVCQPTFQLVILKKTRWGNVFKYTVEGLRKCSKGRKDEKRRICCISLVGISVSVLTICYHFSKLRLKWFLDGALLELKVNCE